MFAVIFICRNIFLRIAGKIASSETQGQSVGTIQCYCPWVSEDAKIANIRQSTGKKKLSCHAGVYLLSPPWQTGYQRLFKRHDSRDSKWRWRFNFLLFALFRTLLQMLSLLPQLFMIEIGWKTEWLTI